jgi:hypothetical protein
MPTGKFGEKPFLETLSRLYTFIGPDSFSDLSQKHIAR